MATKSPQSIRQSWVEGHLKIDDKFAAWINVNKGEIPAVGDMLQSMKDYVVSSNPDELIKLEKLTDTVKGVYVSETGSTVLPTGKTGSNIQSMSVEEAYTQFQNAYDACLDTITSSTETFHSNLNDARMKSGIYLSKLKSEEGSSSPSIQTHDPVMMEFANTRGFGALLEYRKRRQFDA